MTSLPNWWLIPCWIVVIFVNYTEQVHFVAVIVRDFLFFIFLFFFFAVARFPNQSNFAYRKVQKFLAQKRNKRGERNMERNCCNYSPFKPMIWVVIFRLAPDVFISCNPLLSEQNFRCVNARWSRFDWNVGRKMVLLFRVDGKLHLNHSIAISSRNGDKFTFSHGAAIDFNV